MKEPTCDTCWGISEITNGRITTCRWCLGDHSFPGEGRSEASKAGLRANQTRVRNVTETSKQGLHPKLKQRTG